MCWINKKNNSKKDFLIRKAYGITGYIEHSN